MKDRFFRLLHADFKRAVRIIPGIFITALIFACVSWILLIYSDNLIYSKDIFSHVSVGLYIPENNSYNNLAVNFAQNMDSVKESLNIIQVTDVEEGKMLIKDNKIIALIVIPANFADGITSGDNPQIELYFGENVSLEEHLVNDMIAVASDLLGTAQTSYKAFYHAAILQHDKKYVKDASDKLDEANLTYVAGRMNIFEVKNINSNSAHNLRETLTATFLLAIFTLMCFLLTPFYKGHNKAFIMRYYKEGGSKCSLLISKAICGTFLIYLVYIMIFIQLLVGGTSPNITSVITMIPVAAFSATITLLFSELIKSEHLVNTLLFISIILLIYLAGGVIPPLLMPRFLQSAVKFNPIYHLLKYILWAIY